MLTQLNIRNVEIKSSCSKNKIFFFVVFAARMSRSQANAAEPRPTFARLKAQTKFVLQLRFLIDLTTEKSKNLAIEKKNS